MIRTPASTGLIIIIVAVALAAGRTAAIQEQSTQDSIDQTQAGEKFPLVASDPAGQSAEAARTTGTLAIQAIQGTPGGLPIGAVEAEIQLLHRGVLVETLKATLDDHGVVVLDSIPIMMGVQPVVRIRHANLTYQMAGGLMDQTHPEQKLEVVCYELTEEPPAWKVSMHHVMLAESPEGVQVTEVVVVDNPADRTWVGGVMVNSKKVTTAFSLPQSATKVTLGRGFHDWCCSTLKNGQLLNHLPLMPGQTEMVFGYVIPLNKGSAAIDLRAAAPVDHLVVMVPDSITTEAISGLEAGGTHSMGSANVKSYLASNLHQGQPATLVLTGLASTAAAPPDGGAALARSIAAIGGGAIVLLALIVIFRRRPAAQRHSVATAGLT